MVASPKLGAIACALAVLLWSGCSTDPAIREANFLARGKKYFARQDYNRSILEFTNATKLKPRDAEAWYQLALANLAAHKTGDAIAALRRATEVDPKHKSAQLKLAELMVQSHSPEIVKQALSRLEQLIVLTPGDPETLDTMAWAELKLDKPEEAEAHLKEVLSKAPGELKSSATMAAIQLARGQGEAAEKTLQEAVSRYPKSPDAVRALAYLYLKEKKLSDAEQKFQQALKLKPDDVLSLRYLGALQLSQGRTQDADLTYRRLAAIPSANLSYIHAAFLMSTGQQARAVSEFEKLAQPFPSNHAAAVRLISAYLRAGRRTDAVKRVTEMIQRDPKDTAALLFRSRISLLSGKPGAAESDIRKVLRFDPESADAHYGLSLVYEMQDMKLNRITELQKTLALAPSLLGPRVELAKAQIAAGHADAALLAMDQTPANLKDTVSAIVGRNWALLALNRLEDAEDGVRRALRLQRSFDVLSQQGLLQVMKNDLPGARKTADELLRSQPRNAAAIDFAVLVRVAQRQNGEALSVLHDSVAQTANSAAMQYLAGNWYHRLNHDKEARDAFAAALHLNSQYTPARMALAAMDLAEEKIDSARTALAAVVAAQPRNETARLMLANLALKSKNRADALVQYRELAELDPDNVAALNAAAYLLAAQDPDQALKYAEHALELAPDDPSVEDTIGSLYYHRGLYSKAVQYLELAAAKDPTPIHQFHFAMSCFKVGDRTRAQANLLKALAKDPQLAQTELGW